MKAHTPQALSAITLDLWDSTNGTIYVVSVRAVHSGWFKFGRMLGYRAMLTDGLFVAEGQLEPTMKDAVRSALKKLFLKY